MESAAVRILALLGLTAVAASAVLLCARPLIAALEGLLKKWRRVGLAVNR
jgi:rhodanese-related sulfurtransferase